MLAEKHPGRGVYIWLWNRLAREVLKATFGKCNRCLDKALNIKNNPALAAPPNIYLGNFHLLLVGCFKCCNPVVALRAKGHRMF